MSELIQGGKGGSSHTPVESPNTLKSVALAKILDLVSEGEIEGFSDPENPLKSIFLDETQMMNPDGSLNFKNLQVEWRYGTQDQSYIPSFDGIENELGIGVELKYDNPYTRAFTNLNIDAVRVRLSVPALTYTDTKSGDTAGWKIRYAIDVSTDGGPFQTALTSAFDGKTLSKYERDHRIDLPAASSTGWLIRVRRLTTNQNATNYADITTVESMVEIIDAKLRYPNSALVGITVDAEQFPSIPTRTYDLKGRRIRVPTNYDPITRLYSGTWDGTFKIAWTDNPVWIYYDLCTHFRYGLGHIITDAQINKWYLYKIGQYCDQLVPDGKGGMEPRFTCNLYLQKQEDAYKVLQDLATVFRGITFWGNGEAMAVADMPEDPVFTYSQSNVVNGEFNYQGSARKTRYNVCLVSWNDPQNFYRSAVEYVDLGSGIERYGIQQMDMTAIGCTSQGQAQRVGRYALATAFYETQTVTFTVGLDGTLVAPGKIIRVADPLRSNVRMSGRVREGITANKIIVDSPEVVIQVGDSLTIANSSGVAETRSVFLVNGNEITLLNSFSEVPMVGAVWAAERSVLQTQRFRVVSVTEADDDNTYTVTAVRHIESKFDNADTGVAIEIPNTTWNPPATQAGPTNIFIGSYESAAQVTTSLVVSVSWTGAENAIAYDMEYKRDGNDWVSMPRTSTCFIDIRNAWAGVYYARVRAINQASVTSPWVLSDQYTVGEQTMVPGFVGDLGEQIVEAVQALPNVVSKEELVEITQYMMELGTMVYEDASMAAGAKYDTARAMLQLGEHDARIVRTETSTADTSNALASTVTALGARIDDAESLIYNEQTARADADSALATSITALSAQVGTDIQAQISAEATARASADSVLAQTISLLGAKNLAGTAFILDQNKVMVTPAESLATRLNTISTTFGDLTTQLTTETTNRSNADTALAQTIALMGAKSVDGSAFILDLTKVKVDAATTLGVRLTNIDTALGNNASAISTETAARTSAISAISSQITTLNSNVGDVQTSLSTEISTRASADNALSASLSTLTTRVGNAEASLTSESSTRASADTAISNNVTTLTTTVNGHTSSISTQAASINGLSAQYTVKIDNNGYVSGYGLASTAVNGTPTAIFTILASAFRIINPAGGARTEYSDGNWRVYDSGGTLRVRMGVW